MRLRKRTDGRCAPLPTLSWLLVLCILSSQQRPSTNRAAVYHVVAAGRRAAGGRVNATAVCGEASVQMVKSQIGGIGLVVNWLTAGIWAPMHVKITCGPKAATEE